MRTEIHQDRTRKDEHAAQTDLDPAELWLDQDITGEELIELDPLEETEDLLAIAGEAIGDSLQGLPLRPASERLQQLIMKVSKGDLQAKYGTETAADFIRRIKGST